MSKGIEGFPGWFMVLLCTISLREGIFGVIGVHHRSRSRSSKDVLASWLVLRAVLSVLTCCSMKLLDWGKWGEEVICLMYWHWRNHSKFSEMKGGSLSVYVMLGDLYLVMNSWSFWVKVTL